MSPTRLGRTLLALWLGSGVAGAAPPALSPDYPWIAFTHARVYVTPEQVIEDATVVVQEGKVVEVSPAGRPPAGARVLDCSGKVIHAGLVEIYLGERELAGSSASAEPSPSSEGDWADDWRAGGRSPVTQAPPLPPADQAWRQVEQNLEWPEARLEKLHQLGILAAQVVPQSGLLRGQGAVYCLNAQPRLLRSQSCQVVGFRGSKRGADEKDYPVSPMGHLAYLRQAFRSSRWAAQGNAGVLGGGAPAPGGSGPGPASLALLEQARRSHLPFYFEGRSLAEGLSLQRCLQSLGELETIWVGSAAQAGLRPDWLQGRLVLGLAPPKLELHPAQRTQLDYRSLAQWRSLPQFPSRFRGRPYCLSLHGCKDWGEFQSQLQLLRSSGASEGELLKALSLRPAQWLGLEDRLGSLLPGRWANLVVRNGPLFGPEDRVEMVMVQGHLQRVTPLSASASVQTLVDRGPAYQPPPAWPGPGSLLIQGATCWTQSAQGCLASCDILVEKGVIRAIAPNLPLPPGVPVIQAQGRHLIPGLIDAHSHTAIVGNVNEGTLAVTAQVDVADVIHADDPNILRQLAGGVTCANLLHGSANAIGGRSVTVKWRWGARPEEMIFAQAPRGIKFALGENPKQANWGDGYRKRYPQTRLGVAALLRQRFLEARKYQQLQRQGVSQEPDEALEALVEVLEGRRLVHCHSYRQDEILMLLQLAQELGFRVATLQHGLEAYKVADQIAAQGTGCSTFSDWWSYKFEVMDAIPYNGALLQRRGVVTSFNSDSDELARRLLGEASKACKYGGLSPIQALDFLTLNPARQLGIEGWVGSLEVGKQADFSLWSDSPFAPQTHCLATWVDGVEVFQEERYRQQQRQRQQLRTDWLEKAQQGGTSP